MLNHCIVVITSQLLLTTVTLQPRVAAVVASCTPAQPLMTAVTLQPRVAAVVASCTPERVQSKGLESLPENQTCEYVLSMYPQLQCQSSVDHW